MTPPSRGLGYFATSPPISVLLISAPAPLTGETWGWIAAALGLGFAAAWWSGSVKVVPQERIRLRRRFLPTRRTVPVRDVREIRLELRPKDWGGSWSTHGVVLELMDGRSVPVIESSSWSGTKVDEWYLFLRASLLGEPAAF